MDSESGQTFISECRGFVLLGGALFYVTLVTLSYFKDRKHMRPHFDRHDPAHSLGRLSVWLGVMALVLLIRVATPTYNMLAEASAEVGDWFLSHTHHQPY